MRKKNLKIFFFLFSIFADPCASALTFEEIPLKKSVRQSIKDGNIEAESIVLDSTDHSQKKLQELKFQILGLHPKKCSYALSTLSDYENYKNYVDFIKRSEYDENNQMLDFGLSHILLPYDMQLTFKLPRIQKTGQYPFSFDVGFLTGLKGNIHVIDYKDKCLFFTNAQWKGPHSGIPRSIFEFFSQGLSKLSMEILFRISRVKK